MAYITCIIDKDLKRREEFITDIEKNLPGLVPKPLKRHNIGDTTLIWSAIPNAPVSVCESEFEKLFLFFGIQSEAPIGSNAAEIFAKDLGSNKPTGKAFDSEYFLGIKLTSNRTVEIVADMLGIFPLYFWASANRDIFIFSTSPGAPVKHPLCSQKINYRALAGTLLLSHMIGGETIWKNIYRLSSGYKLKWSFGSEVKEERFNFLSNSDNYFGKKEAYCLDDLHNCFDGVVANHVRDSSLSLFLSGGLDSRLLAGYLYKNNAEIKKVFTYGAPDDFEALYAHNVSSELNWDFQIIPSESGNVFEYALNQIELEQGTGGFFHLSWWKGILPLQKSGNNFTGGYLGDPVMGGSHILWGYNKENDSYEFDTLFNNINKWGLNPEIVKNILKNSDNIDAVDEAIHTIRKNYNLVEGRDFQKIWLFDLLNRQRFHISSIPYRLSFGAWPKLPYASPKILSMISGFPLSVILNRAAQVNLLKSQFPKLAALPLEGNYVLIPKDKHGLKHKIRRYLRRYNIPYKGKERRFYRRTFDLNHSDWTEIRELLENYRYKLEKIFESDQINRLIPLSTQKINVKNPIVDTIGIKTLIMLIILLSQHLDESSLN